MELERRAFPQNYSTNSGKSILKLFMSAVRTVYFAGHLPNQLLQQNAVIIYVQLSIFNGMMEGFIRISHITLNALFFCLHLVSESYINKSKD